MAARREFKPAPHEEEAKQRSATADQQKTRFSDPRSAVSGCWTRKRSFSPGALSRGNPARKIRAGLLYPLRVLMDDDLGVRVGGAQLRLDLIGNLVRPK
jgi:hypothetical protein